MRTITLIIHTVLCIIIIGIVGGYEMGSTDLLTSILIIIGLGTLMIITEIIYVIGDRRNGKRNYKNIRSNSARDTSNELRTRSNGRIFW